MKKTLLLFLLTFVTINTLQSQQLSQGESMINLGVGLSSYYTSGDGYKTKLPPIESSYESMISDKISIGGFLGLYSSEYFYSNEFFDFTTKFNYFDIGAVGNYHFVNTDKFNIYAGIKLGYVDSKVTYDENIESEYFNEFIKNRKYKSSGVFFATQIGARYFMSDNFALNAELGYGISLFKVGATIKL